MKITKISLGLIGASLLLASASFAAVYRLPAASDSSFIAPMPVDPRVGLPSRTPIEPVPMIVSNEPWQLPSPINDPVLDDQAPKRPAYAPQGLFVLPISKIMAVRAIAHPVASVVPASEAAVLKLDAQAKQLFDKAQDQTQSVPVAVPVKNPLPRPSRPITLPESDLANEIGLPR